MVNNVIDDPAYAIVCTTPMNAEGVKLICRNSYELQAATTEGSSVARGT